MQKRVNLINCWKGYMGDEAGILFFLNLRKWVIDAQPPVPFFKKKAIPPIRYD
jgi:hypothetical protein